MLRRFHQRIDFFFVVGRAMFYERVNLDSFEAKLDAFLEYLEGVLWAVPRTEPHKSMNAPRVLLHRVGDVLVGFSVIRRLSYSDRKSDDSIHPGGGHRLQHVLRHEFHDRRNLMDGKFSSLSHVRMRVDDFD